MAGHSLSPENKPTFNTFQEVASTFGFGIRQVEDQATGTRYILTVPDPKTGKPSTFFSQPNQTPDQFFNQLVNNTSVRRLIDAGTLNEPNITTEGPGTAPTVKPPTQQDFNPDTRLATSIDDAVKLTTGGTGDGSSTFKQLPGNDGGGDTTGGGTTGGSTQLGDLQNPPWWSMGSSPFVNR